MPSADQEINQLVHDLKERAKELNCLYKVQELLNSSQLTFDEICLQIVEVIPPGWQYYDICKAEIIWSGKTFQTPGFQASPWYQESDIVVREEMVGQLRVYYLEERAQADEGPFLKEERKLIDTITQQIGFHLLHQELKELFQEKGDVNKKQGIEDWRLILELLRQTDTDLLRRVSRKMINHLAWHGATEVERLLDKFNPTSSKAEYDENSPSQLQTAYDLYSISLEVFEISDRYFTSEEILENIQKWIKEEKSGFMLDVLINPASSFTDITSALEHYRLLSIQENDLTKSRERWLRTSLIRKILSDQPDFMNIAKKYLNIEDFTNVMHRVIFPASSRGKLGGKSSGLFLAEHILKSCAPDNELIQSIRTPKTWYITSDSILGFLSYNNMGDIAEQKHKFLSQIRQEHPYIIHTFKSSHLPPEIVKGLSLALNDFGEVPLIVRSSSLLEDQTNASFAGKYKSFFLPNKGTKEERMNALIDAVLEVYASLFSPDPIEYRIQHNLVDYEEEMGIMIQEVVGQQVGDYYLPAFAGIAFSTNEFRWSSRINREDGLIRLVPGLGTRAVDRLSDDYPILIAPNKPGLRVNFTPEDIIYYSPRNVDAINLKENKFDTIEIQTLLKKNGRQYPIVNQIISTMNGDYFRIPSALMMDFEKDNYAVTFEGLFTRTPFLKQIQSILNILQKAFDHPVDIEFAHDGKNLYLLQCRAQSRSETVNSTPIPLNIPQEKTIFTANRYISNGIVPEIKYVVYVDPDKYGELATLQDMKAVGRAVSKLNQTLPKRQFILMGPGRWGSRGDIKLGVNVTYSDINNTAMLIEIARKKKDYVPELSFGTHFFQDLVEASIRYLPLYPDDHGIIFNEKFLTQNNNMLDEILPEYAHLKDVIKVVNIPEVTKGQALRVLINADQEKAIAFLADQSSSTDLDEKFKKALKPHKDQQAGDIHWSWRMQSAGRIAAHMDPERFGVKNFYVFGSTKNANASPQSDIDLLIHFTGSDQQKRDLLSWLQGWSLSLSEVNFLLTGIETKDILDIHIVTDEDIENKNSFALKIGAVTDAARPLPMGTAL